MKAKKESLLNTLANYGNPSCVLIQETKLRFPGTFKIPGYQIFEKVRAGLGGGLLTAIDENLSPVLISTGSDEAEILVIQILVGNYKMRIKCHSHKTDTFLLEIFAALIIIRP